MAQPVVSAGICPPVGVFHAPPVASFAVEGRRASLMFRYWKQHDPDRVFTELAAGREPGR